MQLLYGGYAYTPEKFCELFQKKWGVTLKKGAILVQATLWLRQQGYDYQVKSCLVKEEHMFMFTVYWAYVPDDRRDYCFKENQEAWDLKAELKLEDATFLTAYS